MRSPNMHRPKHSRGFTIVELMIAMTISLMLLVALVGIFVNTSRTQAEMEKTNGLIEGGRVAIQILEEDIVHAGYWGGYVPAFDDLTATIEPGDTPTAIPNPCEAYAAWNSAYRTNFIGISIESRDTLPTGAGCISPLSQRAGTDVLIVRHTETCVVGEGNCEADVAGKLYFQPSFCAAEKNAGTALTAGTNTITLSANASTVTGAYNGLVIRTISGTGSGQYRWISAYDGSTRVATVDKPWSMNPDATTTYAFDYAFGTLNFPLHRRDCVGTGSPATLPLTTPGTSAQKRRVVSDMYYITDVAHPEKANEVVPTLVRSRLDIDASGTIVQLPPELLIEGIEAFRVELGIDDISDSGDPVDYSAAISWADAARTSPTNRGDGAPDEFIRCTTAMPCTAAQLTNVVAVKLYVLARSRDPAKGGHTDTKTYCLGEPDTDGTCPTANTIAAVNDNYKRHAFTTSVRLTNVSGRRETP